MDLGFGNLGIEDKQQSMTPVKIHLTKGKSRDRSMFFQDFQQSTPFDDPMTNWTESDIIKCLSWVMPKDHLLENHNTQSPLDSKKTIPGSTNNIGVRQHYYYLLYLTIL